MTSRHKEVVIRKSEEVMEARTRKIVQNILIAGVMGLAGIASWAVTDMVQPQAGVSVAQVQR
jgi:hypothetical protein